MTACFIILVGKKSLEKKAVTTKIKAEERRNYFGGAS